MSKRTKEELLVFAGGLATTALGVLARIPTEKDLIRFLRPFNEAFDGHPAQDLAYFVREFLPHYGIVPVLSTVAETPVSGIVEYALRNKSDAFSQWMLAHPKETTALLMWMAVCLYEPLQRIIGYGHPQSGDIWGNTVGFVAYLALPKMIELLGDLFHGRKKPNEVEEDMAGLGNILSQQGNLHGAGQGDDKEQHLS